MNKLHFKVGLFTAASLLLAGIFIVYLLHARGFFEKTFHLQLAAASADGVAPGVPVVFSGIEIGRVTTLGLNDSGGIVIRAEFLGRNAKWLRETSTFTLDKPIVGGAKIRVDSPDLDAPALPDNATMLLLTSDISKEIPALVERVKAILDNVEHLTRKDGEINATLANVKTVTGRMTGEYGMLESILGSPEKARAVTDSLDKTRALMTKLDAPGSQNRSMAVCAGGGGRADPRGAGPGAADVERCAIQPEKSRCPDDQCGGDFRRRQGRHAGHRRVARRNRRRGAQGQRAGERNQQEMAV